MDWGLTDVVAQMEQPRLLRGGRAGLEIVGHIVNPVELVVTGGLAPIVQVTRLPPASAAYPWPAKLRLSLRMHH